MKATLIFVIVTLSYAFLTTPNANAKTIYYGTGVELVNLIRSEDTVFTFLSKVKSMKVPDGVVVNRYDTESGDTSELIVKPMISKIKGRLVFRLDTGETIKLKLRVFKKFQNRVTDDVYEFKPISEKADSHKDISEINALEAMKTMLRSDNHESFSFREVFADIWPWKKGVKTKLIKIYSGKNFNGYVYKITNTSRTKSAKVDVTELKLGNPDQARYIQVDNDGKIAPKKSVLLRIVAAPSSYHHDLTLPVRYVKEAK